MNEESLEHKNYVNKKTNDQINDLKYLGYHL